MFIFDVKAIFITKRYFSISPFHKAHVAQYLSVAIATVGIPIHKMSLHRNAIATVRNDIARTMDAGDVSVFGTLVLSRIVRYRRS